ncbi:MAG: hypothetical protein ACRD8O_18155 [Bryobacteraceae bacterium]
MRIRTTIFFVAAAVCYAGQTRIWEQSGFADFEKGMLKNLSLRSDGRLTLAPRLLERLDSSSAYLWAVACDSNGNVYAGGGPGAKLYRIAPGGDRKPIAEFDALEVHAIAIDAKDQIFVGTAPDGKVYRIAAEGKPELFYDPKAKYIWSLAFNAQGDLFVATGDQGEVHRVSPNGQGAVFARTDETHARSIAVDKRGNVIVGTDPGGLLMRAAPSGEVFVLYQFPKKEVTAVAVAPGGTIYAAAVGAKSSAPLPPPPQVAPPPPSQPAAAMGPQRAAAPPPSLSGPAAAPITGGSEVYKLTPDGQPRRVWSHAQDIVYALGFDAAGRVLVGTGNRGAIYRIESDLLYSALLSATPTQVTAFAIARNGRMFATTGNAGKLYEIGPELENAGWIESDVLDAGLFTEWGRLSFRGAINGGKVTLTARSGNLDRPQKTWSAWSPEINWPAGGRIGAPPARFLQWKASLDVSPDGKSPELETVEAAYLPKNVAPRVELIESTPANYRFPASQTSSTSSQSLTLPPIGKRAPSPGLPAADSSQQTLQYAKGHIGARWSAADDNGDALEYAVYIRGTSEKEWKLLKDKVRDRFLTWDSTTFADGEYRLKVIASDSPGNPKDQAQKGELEGPVFEIDNSPPRITELQANRKGTGISLKWRATDAMTVISKAEYSIDGGDWTVAAPVGGVSDSKELQYELSVDARAAGEHTVAVRVEDACDNLAVAKVLVR